MLTYRLVQTIAPAVEPVTLAEAKLHLRVDHTDDDGLITSLITASRDFCEKYTRRTFVNTTFRLSMDEFPAGDILLPRGDVSSVTSVKYYDTDGVLQTLSSANYTVDTDSLPARIVLDTDQTWPDTQDIPNAVQVLFVSGMGAAASNVPDALKSAIKLMVANLYENREPNISGSTINDVSWSIKALLDSYRIQEFF